MDFWFEFASTYSYLAIMRIEAEAAKREVVLRWRPFLLGPIFAAQGWHTSPFAIYPAKGRHMWRDLERRAARYGLPFRLPAADDPRVFPQHSVHAARIALRALEEPWGARFCRDVFRAEFAEGSDISDAALLQTLVARHADPAPVMAAALSDENKQRLRGNVEEAQALGIFGAPSFTVGEELFWGDDRLEDALDWAVAARAV
jgi:2-hydroxychromene-2-carboxylate isomerase